MHFIMHFLTTPIAKLLIFCILSAFIYHFVAGIRHLLMDIHMGEELKSGRYTAHFNSHYYLLLLIILVGVWLW